MRLHNELLKRAKTDGFTLTELLVAASIGVLLSLVAGEALISISNPMPAWNPSSAFAMIGIAPVISSSQK